jgi:archaemetzincin
VSIETPSRRAFLAASMALLAPRRARAATVRRIALQPLGASLPEAQRELVLRALRTFYDLEVVELPVAPLPRSAYYAPRRRYRAEKLLEFLAERLPSGSQRILGLTAVDISTSKPPHEDWGVLGLATLDGAACVISSFRCRRRARSARHTAERFAKTAVHEIGHTLGLEHCPTRGCLMEDAGGKMETTDREHLLCEASLRELERRGHAPRRDVTPPWPKP